MFKKFALGLTTLGIVFIGAISLSPRDGYLIREKKKINQGVSLKEKNHGRLKGISLVQQGPEQEWEQDSIEGLGREKITNHGPPSSQHQINDQQKLFLIKDILISKNDNDSRLDHELKILSEPLKEEIKKFYHQLPREALNERGTLVFLIGRNLTKGSDFQFFKEVLNQPICQSLVNCEKRPEKLAPHDHYHSELTLVYPQAVVLKSLEKFLKEYPKDPEVLKVVQIALQSEHPLLQGLAKRIFFNSSKISSN